MTAHIVRADTLKIPLADNSVDLIVTSPPYYAQRSYREGGKHYSGQIGDEPTPAEYIDRLIEATREWVRVLKPSGSLWVNLGDKQNGSGAGPQGTNVGRVQRKSLLGLPWRYALRCIDTTRGVPTDVLGWLLDGLSAGRMSFDDARAFVARYAAGGDRSGLGLVLRAEVIWDKANPVPEAVRDRVPRGHEQWFHFTKRPLYYSSVDLIRKPAGPYNGVTYAERKANGERAINGGNRGVSTGLAKAWSAITPHALGVIPTSVWEVVTEPLSIPDDVAHTRCCDGDPQPDCDKGIDHHAAFPTEFPHRIIRGWCPQRVCTACGQGRRPAVDYGPPRGAFHSTEDTRLTHGRGADSTERSRVYDARQASGIRPRILGEACACTPYVDHPGAALDARSGPEATRVPDNELRSRSGDLGGAAVSGAWREYLLDGWDPPPSTPGVVLDAFGGTGTVALVADVLGYTGITMDMSADYCEVIAPWRINDPGERARAMRIPKPPKQMDDQGDIFADWAAEVDAGAVAL
jgi:hypothetical protein